MKFKIGIVLMSIVTIIGCDRSRIYEAFNDYPMGWSVGDTAAFKVQVDKNNVPLAFTAEFRCDNTYPYNNLYYRFEISDQQDSVLYSELKEVLFFEPKTGKPLGNGLGDFFTVEDKVLTEWNDVTSDSIEVSIIQFMRIDTLRGVDRVGLRVDLQSED
jgi:gliding motility-associated lipoprotein GldH